MTDPCVAAAVPAEGGEVWRAGLGAADTADEGSDDDSDGGGDSVLREIRRLEAKLEQEDATNQTRTRRLLERATRECELGSEWAETEQLEGRLLDWYV